MLAIRCQFLNGTYQAAMPGAVGEAEWPPHPARLHAALVAAGWAIGGAQFPSDAYSALSWLEQLPAPSIACPDEVSQRTAPGVYVPRNLTNAETRDVLSSIRSARDSSRQSGRVSRRFPTSIPGDEPVWFVWDTEHDIHVPALERLTREVQYLGSSRSPVCCDVVASLDMDRTPNFVPGSGTEAWPLRVAHPGSTDGLLSNRHVHPTPMFGDIVPYRQVADRPSPAPRTEPGPFDELVVRALDPAFPYTIWHTPMIARAFREAVLGCAGDDAPAILHGHECNPHVAFLPLANVGHKHASGQIVGVAVAIPRNANNAERAQIITAVNYVTELRNLGLGKSWRLHSADDRTLLSLAPHRWTDPARKWQTVTPVILDVHPKGRSDDAFERALRTTFAHAGLPHPPASLDWSEIPWQPAAVPAPAYKGHGLPNGLRIHVEVTFDQPLRGPLLVGRGRYFGVGLFAPVVSDHDTRR